jgi:serine/threonine-protein kinase
LLEKVHSCVDEKRWEYLNEVVVTKPGTTQLRLAPGMAVNIIEKCLRALDALHSQKIVHGDIKPPNIMLDRYGSIRLVDIGSAFDLSAYPQRHTWTPQYAPPEVLKGGKWTEQSDLASLGYVLVELLSGQPVFDSPTDGTVSVRTVDTARDQRLLEEKLNLPRRLDDLLPPDVRKSDHLMNLCRRLIDPDPEKRFNDAEDSLEGPAGTYQFLQGLTRAGLAVHYAQEIKRWLADVQKALR